MSAGRSEHRQVPDDTPSAMLGLAEYQASVNNADDALTYLNSVAIHTGKAQLAGMSPPDVIAADLGAARVHALLSVAAAIRALRETVDDLRRQLS